MKTAVVSCRALVVTKWHPLRRTLLIIAPTLVSLAFHIPLFAQDSNIFSLSNGLEIQTRHLANTGIVHARLMFAWTEGVENAPVGTSWMMSKILPGIGGNGMEREAFQSQKDQAGVLSRIMVGRGWIAWDFDAVQTNADLMIQFLADESLRPTWPKSDDSDELSAALVKTMANIRLHDIQGSREVAIHAFRTTIGDPGVAQLPLEPISREQLISYWNANIRRPERAVLHITGDIESVSIVRLVNQHFGPWEGTRPQNDTLRPVIPRLPKNNIVPTDQNHQAGEPEIWIGWNYDGLSSSDATIVSTLMPWILNTVRPASHEVIRVWEPDPGGYCIRVLGHTNTASDELESYAISLLCQPLITDQVESAIKDRNDYVQASGLYPARALESQTAPAIPPMEELRKLLRKCLQSDNLAVLTLGATSQSRFLE